MKPLFIVFPATLLALSCASAVVAQSGAPATAREAIKFIGVLQDPDTTAADERLASFLEKAIALRGGQAQRSRVRFDKQTMPYGAVIRKFADWDENKREGAYLARITPYALSLFPQPPYLRHDTNYPRESDPHSSREACRGKQVSLVFSGSPSGPCFGSGGVDSSDAGRGALPRPHGGHSPAQKRRR